MIRQMLRMTGVVFCALALAAGVVFPITLPAVTRQIVGAWLLLVLLCLLVLLAIALLQRFRDAASNRRIWRQIEKTLQNQNQNQKVPAR